MAVAQPSERAMQNQTARAITMVVGVWLFISAFVWPHTRFETNNTWILGVLCFLFAYLSLRAPAVRYLNALVAIWLFVSAFALPAAESRTVWNNAIVAIIIFVLSLTPGEEMRMQRPSTPAQV